MLGLSLPVASTRAQLAQPAPEESIRRLELPNRVASQKVEEVVARLGLKPGLVVADIGAGTGVFSRPMAKAVAPGGKIYAVDIEPRLLDYLEQRARDERIGNIVRILGDPADPRLPQADVDLAFFNDVLHHIEHRETYLKALSKYIKPNGRIAIVEFDTEVMGRIFEPGAPLMDKSEVAGWMAGIGFHAAQEFPGLFTNKWYIIYARR